MRIVTQIISNDLTLKVYKTDKLVSYWAVLLFDESTVVYRSSMYDAYLDALCDGIFKLYQ